MKTFTKYLLAALCGAAVAIGLSFAVRSCVNPDTGGKITVVRDTTVIHDTIRIDRPQVKTVKVTDTLLVAVSDTVTRTDTLFVYLPIETKVYSDSTYKAQISGYRASLDWIEVYPTNTIITTKITKEIPKKTRWGIGIQVGYGATLHSRQVVLSPYVGVGVSYNIIRW